MSHCANTEIADLTALEMLRRFRSGTLSPVEAAEAALERIHRHNNQVNAYCLVDEETTLRAARLSEQRYRHLQPQGLIDGVPVAIKDVFLTRGWPNLKGSKTVDPNGPWEHDAPAVAALRRHGLVPAGKTTTPELGWKGVTDCPCYGVTGNPHDPTKTAGGSSGGSAAAVVLGMGPLSLGTDAGGSIRIPAGFSGLVGHKPTQGRVPIWPASPFGQLAHPGPMTWTVEDAALLMDVIAESDPRDPTLPPDNCSYLQAIEGGVRGLRIAFSPNLGYVDVDPEIARAVAAAAQTMEALGAQVDEIDPGFSDPRQAFDLLFFGGAANALRSIPEEKHNVMDPALVEAVNSVKDATMLDYMQAMNERAALTEQMSLFHQRYDLLLTPTLPIPAFSAGLEVPEGWHDHRWPSWTPFTYPFNMTGQPACSVPCGFTSDGLPIGVQMVGPRHADGLVLRAAHTYQQAEPLTDRRPT
ncbi:amidase [Halorhodospira halochloris]|uniref:amidase n=1 Tax=Halorhodospira halochloris TaxID=1052 RepID=UPI001EE837F4|nr:amidase [Halorhodospira halochloris]MCG5531230.1 amidase [Halorhodospira halochloris]